MFDVAVICADMFAIFALKVVRSSLSVLLIEGHE